MSDYHDSDNAKLRLFVLIKKYAGRRVKLDNDTLLYHDLQIGGDDAADLLCDITIEFGTRFDGFDFDAHFPDETEAHLLYWATLLGHKSKRRPLSIGHLLDVIAKQNWFDDIT